MSANWVRVRVISKKTTMLVSIIVCAGGIRWWWYPMVSLAVFHITIISSLTMEKRSVAPQTTTPPSEESLPKRRASGEVDCCVPRKRLVCPPLSPTTTCAKSSDLRWCCDICGYYTRYFYKAEECERLHFGPLITTPTDDIDERDDDDDDNGWNVGGVAVLHSPRCIACNSIDPVPRRFRPRRN